jgi:hypothetical protein
MARVGSKRARCSFLITQVIPCPKCLMGGVYSVAIQSAWRRHTNVHFINALGVRHAGWLRVRQ